MKLLQLSFNQIEQTAVKAVRASGLSWGLAEDTARAVRCLHECGLNGARVLARRLDCVDALGAPRAVGGVWQSANGALDPLLCAAALCDGLPAARAIDTEAMAYPLLVCGALGQLAKSEEIAVQIEWRDVRVRVRGDSARLCLLVDGDSNSDVKSDVADCDFNCDFDCDFDSIDALWVAQTSFLRCRVIERDEVTVANASVNNESINNESVNRETMRAQVCVDDWARLLEFAQRTYVPESDLSRRGAGY